MKEILAILVHEAGNCYYKHSLVHQKVRLLVLFLESMAKGIFVLRCKTSEKNISDDLSVEEEEKNKIEQLRQGSFVRAS